MKSYNFVSVVADLKSWRSCLYSLFPAASVVCLFFLWSAFMAQDPKQNVLKWGLDESMQDSKFNICKNQGKPPATESLPVGIVSKTTNLEMRPLWGSPKTNVNSSTNLFTVAVGIRQKNMVDQMVRKFLSSDFVVMLFHYDGIVDEWKDLEWSDRVIHVSAINQTKWWFAKRFLHPDIVAEYNYIFLWDEDLGVENFHPGRYVSIVKDEGLEISQPALDVANSRVHHRITARDSRSNVHRRAYKTDNHGLQCDGNSTSPPCTGWVEMMAPVFSQAAWRCVWYMIQNDLIHAWGLDFQLGYCAQGHRTTNVGVVDSEYIVHRGLPTLGGSDHKPLSTPQKINSRVEVRKRSSYEFREFKKRWSEAAKQDECWIDPFPY